MTTWLPALDNYDDEYDEYDPDDDGSCYWCGGEGWDECDDPLECTKEHRDGMCRCSSCGGSGNAKDMTIW
jgi:hypothetical protein